MDGVYSGTRTLRDTAGYIVDIGYISTDTGPVGGILTIVVDDLSNSATLIKRYDLSNKFDDSSYNYYKLIPLYDSGPSAGFDFEAVIMVTDTTAYISIETMSNSGALSGVVAEFVLFGLSANCTFSPTTGTGTLASIGTIASGDMQADAMPSGGTWTSLDSDLIIQRLTIGKATQSDATSYGTTIGGITDGTSVTRYSLRVLSSSGGTTNMGMLNEGVCRFSANNEQSIRLGTTGVAGIGTYGADGNALVISVGSGGYAYVTGDLYRYGYNDWMIRAQGSGKYLYLMSDEGEVRIANKTGPTYQNLGMGQYLYGRHADGLVIQATATNKGITLTPNGTGYVSINSGGRIDVGTMIIRTLGSGNTLIGENTPAIGGAGANYNTIVGPYAGANISTTSAGTMNTALGVSAGRKLTTGSYNLFLGSQAGFGTNDITTGSYNCLIGHNAGTAANDLVNAIAIGKGAIASASNQCKIGGTGADAVNIVTSGTMDAVAYYANGTSGISGTLDLESYDGISFLGGIATGTSGTGGHTVSFVLDTPTSSDVFPILQIYDTPVTVESVVGTVRGGTSCTFNIEERAGTDLNSSGTDIMTSDLVASTTGATTTTFSNPGVADGAFMVFVASAVSGSVNQVVVQIRFRKGS